VEKQAVNLAEKNLGIIPVHNTRLLVKVARREINTINKTATSLLNNMELEWA